MYLPGITKTKQIIDQHVKDRGLSAPTSNVNAQTLCQKKKIQMSKDKKHRILIKEYQNLPKTRPFTTNTGGEIQATSSFVYLGMLIHLTLQDTNGIDCHITTSGQIMGALRFFWSRLEIDTRDKVHIYHACVLSILLWGAET